MKRFMIASLLAAIGMVVLVGPTHAASRYCYYNPDDPDCIDQGGYGDPGSDVYDDNGDPYLPPPRRRGYDDGFDGKPIYRPPVVRPPQVFQPGSRCEELGLRLQSLGYRRVRPTDCDGKYYEYYAVRGYNRVMVKMKRSSGSIVAVNPR